MYEQHPLFAQPENESIKVWRYMDFAKLISLLDSSSLFFSRTDKLGDPFEGSWTRNNVARRSTVPPEIPDGAHASWLEMSAQQHEQNKNFPRCVAINCWHMNEHESAAMWRLYLKSDEGIAIQSSYQDLRASLIDKTMVMMGVVNYIDYDTAALNEGNVLSPFICKRKSFEHEREVRGVIVKWPQGHDAGVSFENPTIDVGLNVAVDLRKLVHNIYVAPTTPAWFASVVSSVVKRYGYDFPVLQSKLSEEPLY